ncbi:MAG TPA: EamA family transporter [Intrasporangium sp.]|uniref:EamA family transporter n=1 Tax=Intrasporangium sp. TaxID=1925024 RepID=UPI002D774018|nr:EamA family transporter [Intrasporangium sp.]HET7398437.1 EamA family transporter [Intrasporangium sp.]
MTANERSAPVLVLAAILSVQFGGALAATLVPRLGAAGSVTLRLAFATLILCAAARPPVRGRSRADWLTVAAFGLALGAMNLSFYASLAHLPIGVAVTVEFLGPLTLAATQSRRLRDVLAVAAATVGVVLVSGAFGVSFESVDRTGLALAATAGALWAAYIVLSQRTGTRFPGVDGLALAMVVATVVVAPLGLTTTRAWPPYAVGLGLAVAVLSSVLPYSLELVALRHLRQHVFGILLSAEPAVAALAGYLVLGQVLDPVRLLGIASVVVASCLVLGAPGRRGKAPSEPDPAQATGS